MSCNILSSGTISITLFHCKIYPPSLSSVPSPSPYPPFVLPLRGPFPPELPYTLLCPSLSPTQVSTPDDYLVPILLGCNPCVSHGASA